MNCLKLPWSLVIPSDQAQVVAVFWHLVPQCNAEFTVAAVIEALREMHPCQVFVVSCVNASKFFTLATPDLFSLLEACHACSPAAEARRRQFHVIFSSLEKPSCNKKSATRSFWGPTWKRCFEIILSNRNRPPKASVDMWPRVWEGAI